MRKMVLIVLFLGSLLNCTAQQWEKNLEAGLQQAAVQNKKVLLFFSVPEHCETCEKLEQNIFKSPEFLAFADQHYVMVKIDFSYQQDDKNQLQKNLLIVEKYNKDGFFPHVVVLNKEAKITVKTEVYNDETPQEYLSLLQRNTKS